MQHSKGGGRIAQTHRPRAYTRLPVIQGLSWEEKRLNRRPAAQRMLKVVQEPAAEFTLWAWCSQSA
eukprot:1716882-Amphidinium_carterae.4